MILYIVILAIPKYACSPKFFLPWNFFEDCRSDSAGMVGKFHATGLGGEVFINERAKEGRPPKKTLFYCY